MWCYSTYVCIDVWLLMNASVHDHDIVQCIVWYNTVRYVHTSSTLHCVRVLVFDCTSPSTWADVSLNTVSMYLCLTLHYTTYVQVNMFMIISIYIYIYIYTYTYTALTCMHTQLSVARYGRCLCMWLSMHEVLVLIHPLPVRAYTVTYVTLRGVELPVTVTGCTGVWSRTVYMIVWYVSDSYVYQLYLPPRIGYRGGVCLCQLRYRTIQNPGIHSDPLTGEGIVRLCIHPYSIAAELTIP